MSGPRLTRQVVLEAVERVPDGAGGFTRGWTERGQLWAEILTGRGAEIGSGERRLSEVSHRITVRAAPNGAPSRPVAGQRFRDRAGRIFLIEAVGERDAAGRYLICFAKEEVPA